MATTPILGVPVPIEPDFTGQGPSALSNAFIQYGYNLPLQFRWKSIAPVRNKNGEIIAARVRFINPASGTDGGLTPYGGRLYEAMSSIDDLSWTLTGVWTPIGSYASIGNLQPQNYDFLTSLLNGNVNVSILAGLSDSDIEVGGGGGTATVVDNAASSLYVWQPKSVVWTNNGGAAANWLFFAPFVGVIDPAPNELVLNLLTGQGSNPYGGTLQVSRVDNIDVGSVNGVYIVANNDGDQINATQGADTGNALIVGGIGNDTIDGFYPASSSTINVIVAGSGTDTLQGWTFGGTASNIFAYNLGVDTITDFRAGAGSGDLIDLSAISGINSFANVQSRMSQQGANTVINFGNGHTITLDNVTATNLVAGNFLFQPEAAYVSAASGDAYAGQTVQLTFAMTGAVTVTGSPTLTLSNGATATYDAAASSASGHILVFNYTVGQNDTPTNLSVTSVNPNGATITDANGHTVNFNPALNQAVGVEIDPATVTGVTPSRTGEFDSGQQVQLTVSFSQSLTVLGGDPSLTLSDGATATFDHASGNQMVFDYTPGANDHSSNLQIMAFNQNFATVTDANGLTPDFSKALDVNTGVQIGPTLYVAELENSLNTFENGLTEVDSGQTIQLYLYMNEAVTISGNSPSLSLSDGSTATYDAAESDLTSGLIAFDYTVGSSDHSPDLEITGITNGADVKDASGNVANFSAALDTSTSLQIGASPLTVASVHATPAGQASENQLITITITMSEAVTITGTPVLVFNDDETAVYDSGASNPAGKTLVFTYNADPQDYQTGNLQITGLFVNGSTIQDADHYNADFAAAVGVPLGISVGETLTPLTITSITTNASSAELDSGQSLLITLNMSESGLTVNTSGGSPTLTLDNGAIATYDAAASNLAAGKLVFDYVIGANDRDDALWIRSAQLNGATITDASHNAADLSDAAYDIIGVQIGPAVVTQVSTSQTGEYQAGQIIELALNMTDPVTVNTSGGSPTLTLSDGATATYDTSASNPAIGVLVFDYDIGANDRTKDLEITRVNPNGATIVDPSGTEVDFSAALNTPTYIQIAAVTGAKTDDFLDSGVSDILYRNNTSGDLGFYAIQNGTIQGWRDIGASSTAYGAVGTGDFDGGGTTDVLFRNTTTGDAGYYQIDNGVLSGWRDIGAASTAYSVVGTGDFTGDGISDVLFRNNAGGDTGFYQLNSSGSLQGWIDVGASSTAYSVVGIGDFFGTGTDDILYRNNVTGDTGFYAISNGVNTGWHDVGASSTAYSVVGVGDFTGNGTDDILYRNNTSGDTGFYEIVNGVNTGWHDIGASSTAYSVVGAGDYLGTGTDDILFRNSTTGDTGFYAIVNGVNTGWHDIGAASTAYHVVS